MESDITVLVSTSPIKSHPSTRIIDETISSVKQRLPGCEIIIMADGVRKEQQGLEKAYKKYFRQLQDNYRVFVMPHHKHQAQMTGDTLPYVKTPIILFMEHDTPLCGDIPWTKLVDFIKDEGAYVIRLMHEATILEPHEHLMLGSSSNDGIKYTKTIQWSQRPHLASTEFYREMLDKYFSPHNKTFIEDRMHGVVSDAYNIEGEAGWEKFKLWIYTPDGDMKRSYHTDGREGAPKWDSNLVY